MLICPSWLSLGGAFTLKSAAPPLPACCCEAKGFRMMMNRNILGHLPRQAQPAGEYNLYPDGYPPFASKYTKTQHLSCLGG